MTRCRLGASVFDSVVVIEPPGYPHHCFDEIARSFLGASQDLGLIDRAATVGHDPSATLAPLVFGAHLEPDANYPKGSIIFNLEQSGSDAFDDVNYCKLLQYSKVWDYDQANIATLENFYGINATYCGIGYHDTLVDVPAKATPSIDVLFYGSLNERRVEVLKEIAKRGPHTVCLLDTYGIKKLEAISDAKVVVNMHYHEAGRFEIVRCSHLLANGVCVVSESGTSPIEADLVNAVKFAKYEDLPSVVEGVLGNWRDLGARGRQVFRRFPQTKYLEAACSTL